MRRLYVISLIGLGLILFLVVSALLARALSVGGAEDSAITELVKAEAGGNQRGVVSDIFGCRTDPACRSRATAITASLRRAGSVSIIQIQPSTGFSLGGTLGTARVAWLAGGSLPRVQCVRVRHSGDVLQGFRVELLRVSVRIRSNADCPPRY
jgi:hypothetical protein